MSKPDADPHAERNALVPLPHPKRRRLRWPHPGELLVGGLVGAGAAAVTVEYLDGCVREWAVEHPITVGLGSGVVLLVLTVFGVERWLAHVESRRWAEPAREALNTWLVAADTAIQNIWKRAATAGQALAGPDARNNLGPLIQRLAEQDPDELRSVSDFVREQAERAAVVAMNAVGVVARHQPLAGAATMMFQDLRRFDEVAGTCWHLAWTSPTLLSEDWEKVLDLAQEWAQRVPDELTTIDADITHLRLFVMESRDRRF